MRQAAGLGSPGLLLAFCSTVALPERSIEIGLGIAIGLALLLAIYQTVRMCSSQFGPLA
jgi:hypothetical protein